MEHKILKLILLQLKIFAVAAFAFMLFFVFTAFRTEKIVDDIWKQLGITRENGTHNIEESFLRGYFYYYGVRNAKNIATGDKATVAKELLTYTRQHVDSDDFKKQYEQFRNSVKPASPVPAKTKEEIRQELIAGYGKAVKNCEDFLKSTVSMKEDMKALAAKTLADQKKNLEEVKSPGSKMVAQRVEYAEFSYTAEVSNYQKSLAEWEKNYPADVRLIIKNRLQQFLDITKDINFNAQLKDGYGNKKIFVDPTYESKPPQWKMAFRAGEDVIITTRRFAQEWLRELN